MISSGCKTFIQSFKTYIRIYIFNIKNKNNLVHYLELLGHFLVFLEH